MSKLVEQIADQGDAAIARFSEKHLPQSDEAIEKRRKFARRTMSGVALATVIGGGLVLTNELINTADHQAQHVQDVNDANHYKQLIDHTVELPTLPSLEK